MGVYEANPRGPQGPSRACWEHGGIALSHYVREALRTKRHSWYPLGTLKSGIKMFCVPFCLSNCATALYYLKDYLLSNNYTYLEKKSRVQAKEWQDQILSMGKKRPKMSKLRYPKISLRKERVILWINPYKVSKMFWGALSNTYLKQQYTIRGSYSPKTIAIYAKFWCLQKTSDEISKKQDKEIYTSVIIIPEI